MAFFDENHVKINDCIIAWDGITRPEETENGPHYSLKVLINPMSLDAQDFQQLAATTLQNSQFKGTLPQGGHMPFKTVAANEYNGQYTGWLAASLKTTRLPDVYDENGQRLEPMQYGASMYQGQIVDVLVHCYEYNNKSKGIAGGLDGFAIKTSANAPRQEFSGGGINTASAFGAAGQAVPNQPMIQQGGVAPVGQPVQQPVGTPAQFPQQPMQTQPVVDVQQQQQFQQQHNFLPGQS